jgi:hypothetical protein
LLANSAVVHCDETSWSINSVWAFLNDTLTVVFYGVHKDAATLEQILDKRQFAGTLVSDNAAIYQGFTKSQKCWAHLIRKAIKLTLQDPENEHYRKLADNLLLIYRDAKKAAVDGRLGDDGRERRVTELYDRVVDACGLGWTNETVGGESVRDDYHRLCNEIMKLMIDRELFVFVELPGVVGTNNSSERQLRGDALARKTGRTSKTPRGAQRQSDLAPESWSMRSVKKFVNFHNPGGIMKRKRYTEEQIAFALRQGESGTPIADIVRKMGITEQTYYRWKKKFAGMGVAEVRRLKQLEEENRKLKQLVADLSLDKKMLQDVVQGKV